MIFVNQRCLSQRDSETCPESYREWPGVLVAQFSGSCSPSAFLRQAGDRTQGAVIKYVANFDLLSHKKSIKQKIQNLEKEVSLLVVSMTPV